MLKFDKQFFKNNSIRLKKNNSINFSSMFKSKKLTFNNFNIKTDIYSKNGGKLFRKNLIEKKKLKFTGPSYSRYDEYEYLEDQEKSEQESVMKYNPELTNSNLGEYMYEPKNYGIMPINEYKEKIKTNENFNYITKGEKKKIFRVLEKRPELIKNIPEGSSIYVRDPEEPDSVNTKKFGDWDGGSNVYSYIKVGEKDLKNIPTIRTNPNTLNILQKIPKSDENVTYKIPNYTSGMKTDKYNVLEYSMSKELSDSDYDNNEDRTEIEYTEELTPEIDLNNKDIIENLDRGISGDSIYLEREKEKFEYAEKIPERENIKNQNGGNYEYEP